MNACHPTRRDCVARLGALAGAALAPAAFANGGALFGYTHPLPPLSFEEAGQHRGLCVELFGELAAQLKRPARLELQPLARTLQAAQAVRNAVGFPVARLAEREALYRWVGPVLRRRVLLYRLNRRTDLATRGLATSGEAHIVVTRATGTHRMLLNERQVDAERLELASSYAAALRMLQAGRGDYLAMNELSSAWALRQLGLPADTLRIVEELDADGAYWLVVPQTEAALAQLLQDAFETLQRRGRVDALKRAYGV